MIKKLAALLESPDDAAPILGAETLAAVGDQAPGDHGAGEEALLATLTAYIERAGISRVTVEGAWYRPKLDTLGMPDEGASPSRTAYLSTFAHECAPSRGPASARPAGPSGPSPRGGSGTSRAG